MSVKIELITSHQTTIAMTTSAISNKLTGRTTNAHYNAQFTEITIVHKTNRLASIRTEFRMTFILH